MNSSSQINDIFEWIATFVSLMYFLTPLFQIVSMFRGKLRHETLPWLLLLTILLNCLFWIIFALFQNKIRYTIYLSNGIGFIVNIVLLLWFLYVFLDKQIGRCIGFSVFIASVLVILFIFMYSFMRSEADESAIGIIAMCMNIWMYGSPIQNIVKLYRTGEYEFLPIVTNIFGFLSTLSWLVYGALTMYWLTILANWLGFIIINVQIGFWFYYYSRSFMNEKKGKRMINGLWERDEYNRNQDIEDYTNINNVCRLQGSW